MPECAQLLCDSKHLQRHFQAMPMTACWRHTQVKTRFFQMSQECLSLASNSHRSPQRGTRQSDRLTDHMKRMNGWLARWLSARLRLPARPKLCVYLLVRPISSLARLCDWNENEAYTNLQTAKRACTFRPIYSLSLLALLQLFCCLFLLSYPPFIEFVPCYFFLSLLQSELHTPPPIFQSF